MCDEARSNRWAALLVFAAVLITGCAAPGTLVRDTELDGRPRAASRDFRMGTGGIERQPRRQIVRTVASTGAQLDAFEQLLASAGLEARDAWPLRGSALTPRLATRLLEVLLQKPMTLAQFPPRMGAGYLLREVLEGGEVSREELLRRVERFKRVAVLRPDGYLAWVTTGRTQQKVAPVEWKDGAFRALGFELGRFYISNGYLFRPADERLQPVFDSLMVEVYDDADVISRTLDGAQDALVELALAIGKLLTHPSDSLEGLQHLPAGVVALIASSPEYLERFQNMTRGEQMRVLSKLTTTLIVTWGGAGGATRTLGAGLGSADATVSVLSLSAEGTLVMERIAVPVGAVVTTVGRGVGGVYVLSSASEKGAKAGSSGGPGAGKRFTNPVKDAEEKRAGGRCVFCGKETTRSHGPDQRNTDHAVPKSRGGNNTLDNAQNTCRTCNLEKGARTTDEYLQGEK